MDELKIIEHSTLKVPYEHLNKYYRNVQKSVDRDCSSLNQTMNQIDKISKSINDMSQKSDLIQSMSGLVEKLRLVKKRSIDLRNEEKELLESIKKRISNLKEHESENQLTRKNFHKLRLDRILIDYFLRNSYYKTAEALANKNNLKQMTNMEVFFCEKDICESLMNKETHKCLNWCNENKSKLKNLLSFHPKLKKNRNFC